MVKPVRVYDDYTIVVVPHLWKKLSSENHQSNYRACEKLIEQIKRHCDDWDDMYIEVISHPECPYCHLEWELDEDGSPMCCTKAWDEWAKEAGVC